MADGLRRIDNPPNPFASAERAYLEGMDPGVRVEVYEDQARSIVAHNDSPDIGFRYSVNPYRGCQHACAYCYARPTHEYLSLGAGTDFDTKIHVKLRAAELLEEAFLHRRWQGDTVVFFRGYRLLPTPGGELSAHPRLPGGVCKISQPGGDHHQVTAHRA